MSRRTLAGLTTIVLPALLALGGYAQKSGSRQEPGVKVDVDLVLVNATVTDPLGQYVTSLQRENFRIWEDKIEQEIQFFSSNEVPMSLGIILDVSGSMKDKLATCRAAAAACLRAGTHLDEYFLLEFNKHTQITQDFTSDVGRLENNVAFLESGGTTALYDAVYLGLSKVREGQHQRKALLIITDGDDNSSRYAFKDVREFARESDVQIYAIGIVEDSNSSLAIGRGRAIIDELVAVTGGKAFFPTSIHDLPDITTKIAFELKHQYVIAYSPTNRAKDGKWRNIRVKVKPPPGMPSLGVRVKSGYYAAGQ